MFENVKLLICKLHWQIIFRVLQGSVKIPLNVKFTFHIHLQISDVKHFFSFQKLQTRLWDWNWIMTWFKLASNENVYNYNSPRPYFVKSVRDNYEIADYENAYCIFQFCIWN